MGSLADPSLDGFDLLGFELFSFVLRGHANALLAARDSLEDPALHRFIGDDRLARIAPCKDTFERIEPQRGFLSERTVAGKTALAQECFDLLFVFDRRVRLVRALFGSLRLGAERNRIKHAQPSHEPRAQEQGFGTAQWHFHGRWDWHGRSSGEGVRRGSQAKLAGLLV